MATFTLLGAGVQGLTAGVTRLLVDVVTFRQNPEAGQATPTNYFHLGLLREGVQGSYGPSIPIDASSMFIDLAAGVTSLGYSLFGTTSIRVTEQFSSSLTHNQQLQPWDRNSTLIIRSSGYSDPPHFALATLWTYTVPANRKCLLGDAHIWLLKDGAPAHDAYISNWIAINGNVICSTVLSPYAANTFVWDETSGGTLWLSAGDVIACIHQNPASNVSTYGVASFLGNEFDA